MPKFINLTTPTIIAHRGASAYAPENTRAAFLKAISLGAKWVEFDVQLTADGHVVVFHDDDLTRTSTGKGKIIDHTLAYLKSLDIGSWLDPSFQNEKILTLEEVLTLLQENSLAANIEIKAHVGIEKSLATAVIEILQKLNPTVPLLISSFNPIALHAVRKIHPTIPMGYLMDEWSDEWLTLCAELHCVSINLCDRIVTEERIAAMTQAGYNVMVFTVNDPVRADTLFAWGVNAVFSDCPDKIK